ncbi:DUF6629 family protein [Kitasatospora hibisci]|uniref:DUF6629 family protein n=1 Tax=Kitasatospora hibisci TaxID=3369522 RepID=UPI0037540230
MCWSAQADLAAGGVVAGIGLLCLARTYRAGRPERLLLASLPLVLGVHQLIEAAVWFGADGDLPAPAAGWARTAWAVIALPLLPVLVPAGVWCAAREPGRRRRLLPFVLLGLLVAAPLAVAVATHPVGATEHGHTLAYAVDLPHPGLLLTGYLLATVGPLLLSGDRRLRQLGLLAGVGAAVCALLWRLAFVSTWCALAALASMLLLRWTATPSGGRPPRGRPSGGRRPHRKPADQGTPSGGARGPGSVWHRRNDRARVLADPRRARRERLRPPPARSRGPRRTTGSGHRPGPLTADDIRSGLTCDVGPDGRRHGWFHVHLHGPLLRRLGLHPDQRAPTVTGTAPPGRWHAEARRHAHAPGP